MEFEFTNKEELFKRVRPALEAKRMELKRKGILNVKDRDIWIYLKSRKYSKSEVLILSDVVSDIMHLDNEDFSAYLELKNTRRERSEKNGKTTKSKKNKKKKRNNK